MTTSVSGSVIWDSITKNWSEEASLKAPRQLAVAATISTLILKYMNFIPRVIQFRGSPKL